MKRNPWVLFMKDEIQGKLDRFEKTTKENIENWLSGSYDQQTKDEIIRLLSSDPNALKDAFFQKLTFGTAGARGIMGIGTNRLNIYTIRFMAQGLANYIIKQKKQNLCVFIGYDNRNNSSIFAKETAKVLAGNNILVFLFDRLCPTFLVSYAVRKKQCIAGVMITASHNPPEYNGFKVYWQDGGQVLPPHDKGIIEEVNKIKDIDQVKIAKDDSSKITMIYEEIEKTYLKDIEMLQNLKEQNLKFGKDLKCIYTNLHGTGVTLLPKALENWGFFNLQFVEEQKEPDGNFTNAPHPNPEEEDALSLGIEKIKKSGADIFMATDPDCDRIGVVIKHKEITYHFSGNEIAILLLHHILTHKSLPSNGAVCKSIVTTRLFDLVSDSFKVPCESVLTGFKYIAELIEKWENSKEKTFIFGAEESCGYLAETFVRDKDAVTAAALLCEMALELKRKDKTLLDQLYEIYQKFGVFREKVISIAFDASEEGMKKMKIVMENLRKSSPEIFASYEIAKIDDYLSSVSKGIKEDITSKIDLPKSDVLAFHLSDLSTLIIRPSGTEPKIKIYFSVHESEIKDTIEKTILLCDERIKALSDAIQNEISS